MNARERDEVADELAQKVINEWIFCFIEGNIIPGYEYLADNVAKAILSAEQAARADERRKTLGEIVAALPAVEFGDRADVIDLIRSLAGKKEDA